MTDRELVLELAKRLRLVEAPASNMMTNSRDFIVDERTARDGAIDRTITFGEGAGYSDFCIRFFFNEDGSFSFHVPSHYGGDEKFAHGIWE